MLRSKYQALPTEAINPATLAIDKLASTEVVDLMMAEDRRVVHLHLTAKGRRVAAKIWPIVVDGMNVHLDGFRKDELARLNEFLGRMLANGVRDAEAA